MSSNYLLPLKLLTDTNTSQFIDASSSDLQTGGELLDLRSNALWIIPWTYGIMYDERYAYTDAIRDYKMNTFWRLFILSDSQWSPEMKK